MNINKLPIWLRIVGFLSRNFALVRLGRKILKKLGHGLEWRIRGHNYSDIVRLGNNNIALWLDDQVDGNIWWDGYYEKEPSENFKSFVKRGDVVLDVGANIGYYSLLASDLVGPKGQVISFEPVKITFCRLLFNTFGLDNVEAHQSACGNKNGVETIYNFGNACSAGSRMSGPADGHKFTKEEVSMIGLDGFLGNTRVDVAKIDVEGYEINVLKGMENIIKNNPGILLFVEVSKNVLKSAGSSPREIFDFLGGLGLVAWKRVGYEFIPQKEYWADQNLVLFANTLHG